jgi:cephalosporin-C deacetylase
MPLHGSRNEGLAGNWSKTMSARFCLSLIAVVMFACASLQAEVEVKKAVDGSVAVRTSVYSAAFDSKGNLTEVVVKGAKSIAHQFGEVGKPPSDAPSMNVHGEIVAVRSANMRVEYTFKDESVHVLTEGYGFECQVDPSVKAVVVPGGKGGPVASGMYGGASAIVLSNDLTVAYSIPFHTGGTRMVPTGYCNGTIKSGELVEFDLKIGAPVDAVQLLSAISVSAVGSSYGSLLDGGNQGTGMVHFPKPDAIAFTSSQQNLGGQTMNLEYRLSILDHRVVGNEVVSLSQKSAIAPSRSSELRWDVPKLGPGFYYLTISAYRGETKLTDTKQTFTVDLTNYTHPSTRPADFEAFWKKQQKKLASTAANTKMTLISDAKNPNKAYEVFLDLPGGKLHGCLIVPAKIGNAPSQFGSLLAGPLNELMTSARKPDYKPAEYVSFTADLPEDGTYTRWTSAEDNNIVRCILAWLRGVDFLASRSQVNPKRIMVVGASRTGGLTIDVAALRPNNICAANGFVQTSCGLSWQDKPYRGWGRSPDPNDPPAMKEFCVQAAYVDPVNFAPDVKCPTILAYGIDDDLSPPQGIEAAYHALGAAWKRISRDAGGHQYSKGCQQIQQDMLKVLEAGASSGMDQTRTLKDH